MNRRSSSMRRSQQVGRGMRWVTAATALVALAEGSVVSAQQQIVDGPDPLYRFPKGGAGGVDSVDKYNGNLTVNHSESLLSTIGLSRRYFSKLWGRADDDLSHVSKHVS